MTNTGMKEPTAIEKVVNSLRDSPQRDSIVRVKGILSTVEPQAE